MSSANMIEKIRSVAREVLPEHSKLYLYGSRARGDAHEGSDWDLLILLNKPKLEASDYDITYPFRELGWNLGEEISPHIYTQRQWDDWTFLPYRKNVDRDKYVLQWAWQMMNGQR